MGVPTTRPRPLLPLQLKLGDILEIWPFWNVKSRNFAVFWWGCNNRTTPISPTPLKTQEPFKTTTRKNATVFQRVNKNSWTLERIPKNSTEHWEFAKVLESYKKILGHCKQFQKTGKDFYGILECRRVLKKIYRSCKSSRVIRKVFGNFLKFEQIIFDFWKTLST